MSDLQRRIDAVPARESEMTELMRDYETLTHTYNDLLAKREDSKIAANLESRAVRRAVQGHRPGAHPRTAEQPEPPLINLGGMAAGLAIGLVLVALLEYRDRSFKTDDEIIAPARAAGARRRSDHGVERRAAAHAPAEVLSSASAWAARSSAVWRS